VRHADTGAQRLSDGATNAAAGQVDDDAVDRLRAMAATPSHAMDVPFVDLQAVNAAQRSEIVDAIMGVLDRSDFVLGAAVSEFERAFAAFCEVEHAIGVDSGFSALELSLRLQQPAHEVRGQLHIVI
jgi:hypothetical protein